MEIMEKIHAQASLGLSVVIITKNELRHIAACLESVRFADEIIVLDSGSTDGTVEIARQHGASVHQSEDWPGFGPQKNRVLDLATQPWVLAIDADEQVTAALREEIIQVLQSPEYDAYEISRLSEFCGKPIRHSGWFPDYVLRLFRRGVGRFNDVPVHERFEATAPVGRLKNYFLHFPFENLDMVAAKINRYSTTAAVAMAKKGKRVGLFGVVGHCIWTFFRIYILRRGFLDGRYGFVLAVTAAFGSFLRYAKLMFINRAERNGSKS
jgi:glycosyltransferase involved in cell wall biosynthesis